MDAEDQILEFSKNYLIKGWGLIQQNRLAQIKIKYPKNWSLFKQYLEASGNNRCDMEDFDSWDLECILNEDSSSFKNHSLLLEGSLLEDLKITLKLNNSPIREWNYAIPNNESVSLEIIQLSFFLAITDAIKCGDLSY